MAPGSTIAQVEALLGARRFADATRLLFAAVEAGEPGGAGALARWRIAGDIVRRDLAEARRLLARAAAGGDGAAALLHAGFLAAGVGGADDWAGALASLRALARSEPGAAAQLRLIDAMDLDPNGFPARPIGVRRLSEAPRVESAEGFMTELECAYLRAAGEPALQPSLVVDPATGRMVPHPVRSSDATQFGVYGEDVVVNALNRRMAALGGMDFANGEPLQLLRYRPGGEYKPHLDALPAEPNQRVMTILVYLSDDYEGGETEFPRLGLSFRGRVGDALLFRNATQDGRPDPMAVHAGLPVTRGAKYLASRWIRAERFTYPAPRPLLDL